MMKSLLLVFAASFLSTGSAAAQEASPRQPISPDVWTTVGAEIPDVELARVDGGGLVSLKSFRGKRLLLIHFASW